MVTIRRIAVLLLLGSSLASAESEYVDSKVCATCHRDIAADYARTRMAQSFFRPQAANTIEDYAKTPEYYHALSDSYYSMTILNGRYIQRRWQLDASGKEINAEQL